VLPRKLSSGLSLANDGPPQSAPAPRQGRVNLTPEPNVTRFEVIDESGRSYVRYGVEIELSYQDDGRTLKVFVRAKAG
jgi:hypothetical protein